MWTNEEADFLTVTFLSWGHVFDTQKQTFMEDHFNKPPLSPNDTWKLILFLCAAESDLWDALSKSQREVCLMSEA